MSSSLLLSSSSSHPHPSLLSSKRQGGAEPLGEEQKQKRPRSSEVNALHLLLNYDERGSELFHEPYDNGKRNPWPEMFLQSQSPLRIIGEQLQRIPEPVMNIIANFCPDLLSLRLLSLASARFNRFLYEDFPRLDLLRYHSDRMNLSVFYDTHFYMDFGLTPPGLPTHRSNYMTEYVQYLSRRVKHLYLGSSAIGAQKLMLNMSNLSSVHSFTTCFDTPVQRSILAAMLGSELGHRNLKSLHVRVLRICHIIILLALIKYYKIKLERLTVLYTGSREAIPQGAHDNCVMCNDTWEELGLPVDMENDAFSPPGGFMQSLHHLHINWTRRDLSDGSGGCYKTSAVIPLFVDDCPNLNTLRMTAVGAPPHRSLYLSDLSIHLQKLWIDIPSYCTSSDTVFACIIGIVDLAIRLEKMTVVMHHFPALLGLPACVEPVGGTLLTFTIVVTCTPETGDVNDHIRAVSFKDDLVHLVPFFNYNGGCIEWQTKYHRWCPSAAISFRTRPLDNDNDWCITTSQLSPQVTFYHDENNSTEISRIVGPPCFENRRFVAEN